MPTLSNAHLTVEIAAHGAELRSVRTADGAEWMWQGDPAWWTGRAPLLFPIVGAPPEGAVSVGGTRYPMKQHGVARISDFHEAVTGADDHVQLVLAADDATRAVYPFDFRLTLDYRLAADGALDIAATVENGDSRPMPFQFGFHPAFAWPLPGSAGAAHAVEFQGVTDLPMQRLEGGLLAPGTSPAPLAQGRIHPDPAMFEPGAMIFPEGAGSRFRFAATTGAAVEMETRNLPNFALWQKPGAPYLCLEPWHGFNPPAEAGDEIAARPYALTLAPGASASFGMTLRFRS